MSTTPDSAYAVQALLALPLLLMGLSHILQPKMWVDFFLHLYGLETTGVVLRTCLFELVPAVVIITFHWVWSGPETILTIYGILLTMKITISLLVPSIGLKSLSMADRNVRVTLPLAGVLLIALSVVCFWALLR